MENPVEDGISAVDSDEFGFDLNLVSVKNSPVAEEEEPKAQVEFAPPAQNKKKLANDEVDLDELLKGLEEEEPPEKKKKPANEEVDLDELLKGLQEEKPPTPVEDEVDLDALLLELQAETEAAEKKKKQKEKDDDGGFDLDAFLRGEYDVPVKKKKEPEPELDLSDILKEIEESEKKEKERKRKAELVPDLDLSDILKEIEESEQKKKALAAAQEEDAASDVSSTTRNKNKMKNFKKKWEAARRGELESDYWMVASMWSLYARHKPFKKCVKDAKIPAGYVPSGKSGSDGVKFGAVVSAVLAFEKKQVENIIDYTWEMHEDILKWTEEDFQEKFDADGNGNVGRREAANGFVDLCERMDDEEKHCVFALFAGWPLGVEVSYYMFVETWMTNWCGMKIKAENFSWLRDDRAKPDATEIVKSLDSEGIHLSVECPSDFANVANRFLSTFSTTPRLLAESSGTTVEKLEDEDDEEATKKKAHDLAEHFGVRCSRCRSEVQGVRYKCGHCPNFDLCSTCEENGSVVSMVQTASNNQKKGIHDAELHALIRIREPIKRLLPTTVFPTFSEKPIGDETVGGAVEHDGVSCAICRRSPICNTRWRCANCVALNLCDSCDSKLDTNLDAQQDLQHRFGHHHPSHLFIKIIRKVDHEVTGRLLSNLYLAPDTILTAPSCLSRHRVVSVATGWRASEKEGHVACVTDMGSLFTGGSNDFGQLGRGLDANSDLSIISDTQSFFVQAACGSRHTCALSSTGLVYTCGSNRDAQCMSSNSAKHFYKFHLTSISTMLTLGARVVQVACGSKHTMCRVDNGMLYGCGSNFYGQLGIASRCSVRKTQPTLVKTWRRLALGDDQRYILEPVGVAPWIEYVSCGKNHTVCLSRCGQIFSTGQNSSAECGLICTSDIIDQDIEMEIESLNRKLGLASEISLTPPSHRRREYRVQGDVTACCVESDVGFFGCADGGVRVLHLVSARPMLLLQGPSSECTAMCSDTIHDLSTDIVACGFDDGSIYCWNFSTWKLAWSVTVPGDPTGELRNVSKRVTHMRFEDIYLFVGVRYGAVIRYRLQRSGPPTVSGHVIIAESSHPIDAEVTAAAFNLDQLIGHVAGSDTLHLIKFPDAKKTTLEHQRIKFSQTITKIHTDGGSIGAILADGKVCGFGSYDIADCKTEAEMIKSDDWKDFKLEIGPTEKVRDIFIDSFVIVVFLELPALTGPSSFRAIQFNYDGKSRAPPTHQYRGLKSPAFPTKNDIWSFYRDGSPGSASGKATQNMTTVVREPFITAEKDLHDSVVHFMSQAELTKDSFPVPFFTLKRYLLLFEKDATVHLTDCEWDSMKNICTGGLDENVTYRDFCQLFQNKSLADMVTRCRTNHQKNQLRSLIGLKCAASVIDNTVSASEIRRYVQLKTGDLIENPRELATSLVEFTNRGVILIANLYSELSSSSLLRLNARVYHWEQFSDASLATHADESLYAFTSIPWPDFPPNESAIKVSCGADHTIVMTVAKGTSEAPVGETSIGLDRAKGVYVFGLKCYTRKPLEFVTSHDDDIFAISFPRDKSGREFMLTGGDDSKVRSHDPRRPEKKPSFKVHKDFVRTIVLYNDLIITGCDDKRVRYFESDYVLGEPVRTYKTSDYVIKLFLFEDKLYGCCDDGSVFALAVETAAEIMTYKPEVEPKKKVSQTEDDDDDDDDDEEESRNAKDIFVLRIGDCVELWVAYVDKVARCFDAQSGRQMKILTGHTDEVTGVTATENWVFTCSDDCTVRKWSRTSAQQLAIFRGHSHYVNLMGSSPALNCFFTSSKKEMIQWDMESGKILAKYPPCQAMCIRPREKELWMSSSKKVSAWNFDLFEPLFEPDGEPRQSLTLEHSRDLEASIVPPNATNPLVSPQKIVFIKGVSVDLVDDGWAIGEARTVRWLSMGVSVVSISVVRNEEFAVVRDIPDVGSYDMILPSHLSPASGYQILVFSGTAGSSRSPSFEIKAGDVSRSKIPRSLVASKCNAFVVSLTGPDVCFSCGQPISHHNSGVLDVHALSDITLICASADPLSVITLWPGQQKLWGVEFESRARLMADAVGDVTKRAHALHAAFDNSKSKYLAEEDFNELLLSCHLRSMLMPWFTTNRKHVDFVIWPALQSFWRDVVVRELERDQLSVEDLIEMDRRGYLNIEYCFQMAGLSLASEDDDPNKVEKSTTDDKSSGGSGQFFGAMRELNGAMCRIYLGLHSHLSVRALSSILFNRLQGSFTSPQSEVRVFSMAGGGAVADDGGGSDSDTVFDAAGRAQTMHALLMLAFKNASVGSAVSETLVKFFLSKRISLKWRPIDVLLPEAASEAKRRVNLRSLAQWLDRSGHNVIDDIEEYILAMERSVDADAILLMLLRYEAGDFYAATLSSENEALDDIAANLAQVVESRRYRESENLRRMCVRVARALLIQQSRCSLEYEQAVAAIAMLKDLAPCHSSEAQLDEISSAPSGGERKRRGSVYVQFESDGAAENSAPNGSSGNKSTTTYLKNLEILQGMLMSKTRKLKGDEPYVNPSILSQLKFAFEEITDSGSDEQVDESLCVAHLPTGIDALVRSLRGLGWRLDTSTISATWDTRLIFAWNLLIATAAISSPDPDVVQFILDTAEMGIGPTISQTPPEKQGTFEVEAELSMMLHTQCEVRVSPLVDPDENSHRESTSQERLKPGDVIRWVCRLLVSPVIILLAVYATLIAVLGLSLNLIFKLASDALKSAIFGPPETVGSGVSRRGHFAWIASASSLTTADIFMKRIRLRVAQLFSVSRAWFLLRGRGTTEISTEEDLERIESEKRFRILSSLCLSFRVLAEHRQSFAWKRALPRSFIYLAILILLTAFTWLASTSVIGQQQNSLTVLQSFVKTQLFAPFSSNVKTASDVLTFINTTVIPMRYTMLAFPGMGGQQVWESLIFSSMRVRQVRVRDGTCRVGNVSIADALSSNSPVLPCYGPWSVENEDRSEFNGFVYKTADELDDPTFFAQSGTIYSGGGYVYDIELGSAADYVAADLANFQALPFFDAATRAVFVEFSLYSPAFDLVSVSTFCVEITPITSVYFSSRIVTYTPPRVDASFILFALVATFLVGNECFQFLTDVNHFSNFWNGVEFTLSVGYLLVIALNTASIVTGPTGNIFAKNLQNNAVITLSTHNALACVVILAWLTGVKYLVEMPGAGPIVNGILNIFASSTVAVFLVVYIFVFVSFGLGFYFFAGADSDVYSTVQDSLFAEFKASFFGGADITEIVQSNKITGTILYVVLSCLTVLVLTNILIAIVSSEWETGVAAGQQQFFDSVAGQMSQSLNKKLEEFSVDLESTLDLRSREGLTRQIHGPTIAILRPDATPRLEWISVPELVDMTHTLSQQKEQFVSKKVALRADEIDPKKDISEEEMREGLELGVLSAC